MIVLGLTGSIGMGKTETAKMFARLGAAVYDADRVVRELYAKGGAGVDAVRALFPDAVLGGAVDKDRLADLVLGEPEKLARLESAIHPLVQQAERVFLDRARAEGRKLAVLDIPLLFETGADARVDKTLVVWAPEDVQRARVLARPGMTPEKFDAIRARQMPDAEKRARADFEIRTDRGLDAAFEEARAVYAQLTGG
ncbi:MAG: dephospho-CoA kinase [Parvularculaceae bacterium]